MGDDHTQFSTYLRAQLDRLEWTAADLRRHSEGIGQSLISRWLRDETTISLDNARKLADAINRPLLEVLVASGQLRPDELDVPVAPPIDLRDLSHRALLSEIERRLHEADRGIPTGADVAASPGEWHEGPDRGGQGKRRRGRRAQGR